MRFPLTVLFLTLTCFSQSIAEPLPIDPLWKSESFREAITGSFGIDSRIEPRLTEDEAFYLEESAKAMAEEDRAAAIKILTDSPLLERSAAMLFNTATFQFESGETGAAIQNFQKALALFPNFRDAHRNLAVALVREDELEKAESHLIDAVRLGAGDGLTMGLLGYCHAQKGNPQAALTAYRIASLTQPEEMQWKIGEGRALQDLDHHAEANSIFQDLVDASPDNINLWRVQAETLINLEEETAAIANLELAHRAADLPPVAILSLGHLYLQSNLPDLALERYEDALASGELVELDRVLVALEMLANQRLFERANRLIAAIEQSDYDLTTEAHRGAAGKLTRTRALIELETGDPDKGAEELEAWLASEPTDGLALILLAKFKENANLRGEAEMLLEQAAGLSGHEAEALLAHGRLLTNAGDYSAAVEKLEQAARLDPGDRIGNYLSAVRELAE